jgi:hypothetical protein
MPDKETIDRLSAALVSRAGGYLRNPVRQSRVTCAVCTTPAAGYECCPRVLAGSPVTHWASVPSLPAKPGEHPLHRIVSNLAPGAETRMSAAATARFPRDVNPDHFSVDLPLPRASHVLLIDDTWTGGGHAQSAVLALRRAGAARVSLLVIARWIKKDFGSNAEFLLKLAGRDYDPGICPWTGGSCPRGGAC